MKIVYDPKALAQLDAILAYIAERSPSGAANVATTIKQAIDQLASFPRSGRASKVADVRELPIVRYPYIVFYAVNDAAGEVNILPVRHAAQDPERHLD